MRFMLYSNFETNDENCVPTNFVCFLNSLFIYELAAMVRGDIAPLHNGYNFNRQLGYWGNLIQF